MKSVISNEVSRVPAFFREYCAKVREVEEIRRREPGGPAMRASGAWWAGVDESMRVYLLSSLGGDDWERYLNVRWVAIPESLREVISQRSRAIERQLRACPWR